MCPVCEAADQISVSGGRFFCPTCHHVAHPQAVQPDYRAQGIAGGYTPERLKDQLAFLAPACRPHMRVFELGSADGALAHALCTGFEVTRYEALEISPDAAEAVHIDKVHTQWEDMPQHSFHLVIASHVLEHLVDIRDAAAKLARLLHPSGTLFIEVPHRSGHPALPLDTNPGHLHSFSVTSLTRLHADVGLMTTRIADSAFETSRYPDSLRILARPTKAPVIMGGELAEKIDLPKNQQLVVWGAGGMARELIAPYFPAERIAYYVDRSPELHGTTLAGRPVRPPETLKEQEDLYLLISSLDYEAQIREQLKAAGIRPIQVWGMGDLLAC